MLGEQLSQSALTYCGTPFHYGARIKGVGIDCAGLIVCALRELGCVVEDVPNCAIADHFELIHRIIKNHFDLVGEGLQFAEIGDLLLFRRMHGPASRRIENHVGILTSRDPACMVHAFPSGFCQCVTVSPLGLYFTDALVGIWRYRVA